MSDGKELMTFFRELEADSIRCPDVVLLDLNLPRIDGFKALAYLRTSVRCRQLPVVVMSSSAAAADRRRSETFAVRAYFVKPSTYGEFLALGAIVKDILM